MICPRYLAGLVDGEGYLALARIRRPGRSPEYCVRLVVYNTNLELLCRVQRSWGGTLSSVGQRRVRWKPSYALIWTNAAASELVQVIAPYLRIKASQATLLLRYQDHLRRLPRSRDPQGHLLPLPAEERLRREGLFSELKELNTRDTRVRGRHSSDGSVPVQRQPVSPRYVAGFVDGEGSLMITRSKSRRHGWVQFHARIAIANTDRRVLEDIQRSFGGILVSGGRREANWNPGFLLVWTDGKVERFLASVGPHLHAKQRQAHLLTEFLRHKHTTVQGRLGKGFAPHPAEVVAYRESCHASMGRLNARGTFAPPRELHPHSRPG